MPLTSRQIPHFLPPATSRFNLLVKWPFATPRLARQAQGDRETALIQLAAEGEVYLFHLSAIGSEALASCAAAPQDGLPLTSPAPENQSESMSHEMPVSPSC